MLWGEVLVKHPLSKGQPWIIDTMLWGEVLVNTSHSYGQPWIIDTMLWGEVLVKHPPQLGTTLDH